MMLVKFPDGSGDPRRRPPRDQNEFGFWLIGLAFVGLVVFLCLMGGLFVVMSLHAVSGYG